MREIERKFLLIGPIPDGFVQYANILQGYFAIEGENQCRIRILKTSHKKWFNDNIKCTLTLKSNTSNKTIRNEYEFPIKFGTSFGNNTTVSICFNEKKIYIS